MISNIASYIVDVLISNKIVEVKQAPVYQYGFEIFISSFLTCLITVGLGIIFKCLKAALLYFGIFVLLRSICGGYHAKTYRQCNLIFLTITVIVLSIFKFIPLEQFNGLHICSIAISILTTVYYAPVENENKPLSTRQKKFFRIFGTALVVLLALISCLLKIKISSSYSIIIDTTLLVVAISMFVTEPRRGGEQKWTKQPKDLF